MGWGMGYIIIIHAKPYLVPKLSSCLLLERYLPSKSGMEDYFANRLYKPAIVKSKKGTPHL